MSRNIWDTTTDPIDSNNTMKEYYAHYTNKLYNLDEMNK